MIKAKWILSILIMCFISCKNKGYEKSENLKGLSESQVVEKLGNPLRENIITVHKNSTFTEYQYDLFALKEELKNVDTIKVKEMFWEHKKKNQVVWFTKQSEEWKEFDNLTWSKDIQF